MKHLISVAAALSLGLFLFSGSVSLAADPIATLRGSDLGTNPQAPMMTKKVNSDIREVRNYPEQPPTIPHNIRGYQIDLKTNKCMSCHSRTAIGQSQAPMISITHFMDRDGQVLAAVTPRRFFCTQCHVPQHMAKPLVKNQFIDADELLKK
jgi:cytochrome c-type protein NapB